MHDPFPIPPPPLLVRLTTPLAETLSLPTLPIHIHELLFAAITYHLICTYLSPFISSYLFPRTYPSLNTRTKLNWDVHVVSLIQSLFVCATALWVIWRDDERRAMGLADGQRAMMGLEGEAWRERVWGYTGAGGMIQGFAAGYFLWDLQICLRHMSVFGVGLLMHAVAALVVFSLGFRPFVNYYGPTFILYELSSPFLNFHWFFDKLHMTGSRPQWYNGILLLASFFSCRLLWGTYQSLRVYQDCWAALHVSTNPSIFLLNNDNPASTLHNIPGKDNALPTGIPDLMRYHPSPADIPTWLALTYLGSNVVLNTLNFYWFGKMIETVRKRFRAPSRTEEAKMEEREEDSGVVVEGVELDGSVLDEKEGVGEEAEVGGKGEGEMNGGAAEGGKKEEDDGVRKRRGY
ncbi:MAG: hypothetical protein Q9202_004170 [Teloschistes flavicans]